MGRTHTNLLSTQKNVLADCLIHTGLREAVRACLRFFLLFIPACHLEAGQSRKKDNVKKKRKHHLYVKAHLL